MIVFFRLFQFAKIRIKMKIEILLECLIVLMLEYWRSQITQTIRQSDNQAFIQAFFGLLAVCRLNHVPKADWLGKPRFEAISLTLNLPLRSCRMASSRRWRSIHWVGVYPEVCLTQMLSRFGVMFSCDAYQPSECCWRKFCSTNRRKCSVCCSAVVAMRWLSVLCR